MRTPDHITDPVDPVPVVNIANALTVLRILLVPVFVAVLFIDGGHDTVSVSYTHLRAHET